jgi:hypothetical protein
LRAFGKCEVSIERSHSAVIEWILWEVMFRLLLYACFV